MDRSVADCVISNEAGNEWKSNSTEGECDLFKTCLVCKLEFTNRQPRLLPCLHSFCRDCVPTRNRSLCPSPTTAACQERSSEEGIICCPACRQTCFTSDVVENVFIRDYPQVMHKMEKHCSNCKEKKPALHFCSDCNKWLCSTCSEEHMLGKETKHHKLSFPEVTTGDRSEVDEFPLFCPLHSKEPMKLFCETCDVLACWNCQLSQHKGHSFKYLEDALQNQKMILEELSLKMEEKKVSIQNTAKQVEDRLNEVKQIRMKVENQIKMAKMIMMNELNKRVNVLMDQLENITNERKLKLEHQLQAMMGLCKHLEHVLNFVNWAASKKNDIPFLFSKELILFQVRRLLETQCNVDVGPSKIQFRWDSTMWTKQLSTLGHLSFDCENATRQECQASFHQGASPLPCEIANHRPSLQSPLLCQKPGQQYSVCNSHCPDMHPLHKEHETLNCMQHHRNLGQISGHLQHQLPMQYSSIQPSRSQQKYFSHPLPVQPIPTLHQWRVSQTGVEHSPVLLGHLQASHLQQNLHPTYTIQQQRNIKPMHLVALQQPKQFVHQLQSQKQPCQIQYSKQSKQSVLPPYPVKQQLQLQNILLPSMGEALGKSHTEERKQQSTASKQICQPDRMPMGLKDLLDYSQQLNQNAQCVQDIKLAQNSITKQHLKKRDMPVELQHLDLQRAAVNDQDQQTGLGQQSNNNQLHNCLDAEEQQIVNSHRTSTITLQPVDLVGISNTVGKQSTTSRLTPSKKSSTTVKKRRKRSASGQIKCRQPLGEDASHLAPSLIELQSQLTVHRSDGGNQDLLVKNVIVNGDPKSTEKNKSEESNTKLPKESMKIKSVSSEDVNFKEPINLSMNVGCPAVNGSRDSKMDSLDGAPHDMGSTRTQIDGVKVPYVRLERLPICAPSTGQLPVFKLQSDVDESEGSLIPMDNQTPHTATKNITLDNTLTPPNSNPPPPQQSELDDTLVTSDLSPEVVASSCPLDDKPSEKSVQELSPQTTPVVASAMDNNEDYCAVCLNGGELLCCDRCPKVFHLGCHVPSLLSFPTGEWLCTLCRNVVMPEVEYDCENTRHISENRGIRTLQGLSIGDQRKCEKLALHLYCHPLSLPFHEPVSPLARHYYQIIKRPMDLSTIRAKLQKKNPLHYYTPEEFISDIHLMLMNCAKFNYIQRWPKLEEA
ncbi:tripartite motif-containing protein 66 isoform X3 [Stegostoma tigrinum]|uniref:tripartite motif-containing protein 66 isoform X3 n=1 Tax=Stegostoma tigrinum TaxID=3053191 RepID=UPI00286FBAD9|nr:tripartite motif-containing protein 66 isoform X3 [Stegostoma tigrinum]